MMRLLLPFSAWLVFSAAAVAAEPPRPQPLEYKDPLAEKNFPLLAALGSHPEAVALAVRDESLARLADRKLQAHRHALAACEQDRACLLEAFRFSQEEVDQAASALLRLASSPPFRSLAQSHLRPAGTLIRYHAGGDGELLARGWRSAAAGLNRLIDVYGVGTQPRYPAIDTPMFDPASDGYRRLIYNAVAALAEQMPAAGPFYERSLRFGLALLEMNLRDESARYEPMHRGENRAAFGQIPRTAFERFPYTAIVVPGAGSDRPGLPLSPAGKFRSAIAARRYHAGQAPFIIVSGGFVHPKQTPYCEAVEMKKALIRDYGVPEQAILIDPHARHTTTNIRNAARILYRYGFPFERRALITTDIYQSRYIEAESFAERCRKELGYVPFGPLKRTSPFDLEWTPVLDSLHADPEDPLDP